MIGLDTNILVRYLAQDDPAQSARAVEIIEQQLTQDDPGYVSLLTIAEVVWVLEGVYGQSASQVANALEHMLQAEVFVIQNEQEVFTAMMALKSGKASFADALIGALGIWAGCKATLTFDKKATRLKEFRLA